MRNPFVTLTPPLHTISASVVEENAGAPGSDETQSFAAAAAIVVIHACAHAGVAKTRAGTLTRSYESLS